MSQTSVKRVVNPLNRLMLSPRFVLSLVHKRFHSARNRCNELALPSIIRQFGLTWRLQTTSIGRSLFLGDGTPGNKGNQMDDLIDGTIDSFPVSLLIQRDNGGKAYGAHCCAYASPELDDDIEAETALRGKCDDITDACDGLKPTAALRKAKAMGFVPDVEG
jgi:hypothetical protein